MPEVVQSSGEVRLAASGQAVSVKLMDELLIEHPQLPVQSKLAIELEAIAATAPVVDPDFVALLSKTRRCAATDSIVEAPSEAELDDARIGNLDFATILQTDAEGLYEFTLALPQTLVGLPWSRAWRSST